MTHARDSVDVILQQWKQERPDLDASPMGVIGRISRLERNFGARVAANFRRCGLERWGFDVLAALRRSGSPYRLTPTELFKSLMLTSGAMTHRIDCLEALGLVKRTRDMQDRRGILVALTPKGKALVDRAVVAHLKVEAEMIGTLNSGERKQLAQLLRTLLLILESPKE